MSDVSLRLIRYPSRKVELLSLGVADMLAQRDLMRTQHSMAQEDMTTFSCTRSLRSANRMTQRMPQQEVSAMEQGSCCASFQEK